MTNHRETSNPYMPVALSILGNAVQRIVWRHMDRFGPERIFEMLHAGGEPKVQEYLSPRFPADPRRAAQAIIEISMKMNIRIIHYWDAAYPYALRQIPSPPIVLYVAGNMGETDKIAVVGTRMADARSRSIGRRISSELSRSGYSIVSGMALGIDREAHLGGLEGGGGTVAVLANGINVPYPRGNADIFRAIMKSEKSALVSEYPPGIIAGRWTFVRRNRLISGLSRGTVVVMAGAKSGALITARYAAEQNREVFACPGPAFSEDYMGCHDLIRSGAVLVSKTEDILSELSRLPLPENCIVDGRGISNRGAASDDGTEAVARETGGFFNEKKVLYDENSIEGRLLSAISGGQMHVDSVIRSLGEPAASVQRALSRLELEGHIARNGNYIWRV